MWFKNLLKIGSKSEPDNTIGVQREELIKQLFVKSVSILLPVDQIELIADKSISTADILLKKINKSIPENSKEVEVSNPPKILQPGDGNYTPNKLDPNS
jgi:hypothetical protein